MPPVHVPPSHEVPQAPQFVGLVSRFTQLLVARQYVSAGLTQPQLPSRHVSGGPQIEPGHVEPQCAASVLRSTQPMPVPQSVSPVAQAHVPPRHDSPLVQATLQPPQLAGSDDVSVQVPDEPPVDTQYVCPVAQAHAPATHVRPPPQTFVHEPQCCGSVLSSTHPTAPPQSVCPAAQPQAPATQDWPVAHALLQVPQLAGSVEVSVQTPTVSPTGSQ